MDLATAVGKVPGKKPPGTLVLVPGGSILAPGSHGGVALGESKWSGRDSTMRAIHLGRDQGEDIH